MLTWWQREPVALHLTALVQFIRRAHQLTGIREDGIRMSFWFYSREHGDRRSLYSVSVSRQGMMLFVVIVTLALLSFASRLF